MGSAEVLKADAGDSTVPTVSVPQPPAPQPQPPPPAPTPAPQPPTTSPVIQPDALALAEAAVLAAVAGGATPSDALATHPLPVGTSSAQALAFLAQLPQTQVTFAPGGGPQVITGPPVVTLTGDEPGTEIADPTAFDGWEYEPFFGSGGGLSEDEAEAKILRGTALTTAVQKSCAANDIDVLAAYANALAEGLNGGIGDSGNAFGPWQIWAEDGRLPQFNDQPLYSVQVQAWAWTGNGIEYAIRSMRAGGAKGLKGHAAVHAIVYGFERPSDKTGAYTVRSGIYDTLLAKGSGVTAYIAGIAQGPSLTVTPAGGTTTDGGTVTATAISSSPTGTAWKDLMSFIARDLPFAATHAKSLSDDLISIFK